ncbi:lipase family protein [Gordonia sp. ABSL11-1]|uniref:lipase family protein n=1 Tax=Gordonia sp. ABSL11-1 TaxID=3053924 RepID=UPI002572CCFC|nr:lipase family protein [Gordonia sp. ABSL11-1]MDL9946098.1 lipase family protein [Gordonia sp. ABSL11-1]
MMRTATRSAAIIAAVVLGVLALVAVPPAHGAPQQGAGTVLNTTDITDRPDAKVAGAGRVISMTYLSEGSDGKIVPVRGTVMIPSTAPRPGGWRVLGYAHGTAGLGDDCTVTDRMGHQGRYDDWLGPWLKDGYVITATEYAGIGGPGVHAYLDGAVAGRNVLDSVRAARTVVARQSGSTSNGFVTSGASQGGHASLWASNLAPSYAPELTDVGGVVNSPPVGLAEYFQTLRPGFPPVAVPDYITYFSYVLAGLKVVRPDAYVDSYLTPLGRKVVEDAKTLCYPNQGRATKGLTVGQLIARPFAEGPLIPALREATRVPTAGYRTPLLIQQGTLDPVAFAPLTEQFVSQARSQGATIDFRTAQAGHGLGAWSETAALRWADQQRWP